jgi:hypothetical protein
MICAKRRSSRYQRGSVTILVAIAMVSLIGILALVVDYGNVLVAQTALQNYVDAKALAHLKEEFGLPVPRVSIEDNVPFQLGTPDAVPQRGAWRFGASEFDDYYSVTQAGVPAIQVPVYEISQPLLLSGFFGVHHQTLSASAVSFVKKRHIVIIQDVSGSMNQDQKMPRSRTALLTFVDFMAARPMPGDEMGLVSFSDSAQIEVSLDAMRHSHVGSLRNHINGLSPDGLTHTEDGLDEARQMFAASPDDMADQIAILVTDGDPTDESATDSAADALCSANPRIQLNTVLIKTENPGPQPDPCHGGRQYENVAPDELHNILFNILSGQQVRLVD